MDLEDLKKLAGVSSSNIYQPYTVNTVSNNREIEISKNIQPGSTEWFNLWFKPTGPVLSMPRGFRGRKK